jgi:hypothetical protein
MGHAINSANQWDHIVAHKMRADCALSVDDGRAESVEDASGVEIDEIAEVLASCGVGRAMAAKAAERVFARQAKRDGELAKEMGAKIGAPSVGELGAPEKLDLGDRLRSSLSRIWDARDAHLELGCLFIAMDGHGPLGAFSMRQMAASHGVSPEAVSVKVGEFQAELGLPRTAQQKSAAAVESYRRTNGAPKRARITKTKG